MHIRVFLGIWESPTPSPLLPGPTSPRAHRGREGTDGGHDHERIAERGERDRPRAVRSIAVAGVPDTESVGERGRPRRGQRGIFHCAPDSCGVDGPHWAWRARGGRRRSIALGDRALTPRGPASRSPPPSAAQRRRRYLLSRQILRPLPRLSLLGGAVKTARRVPSRVASVLS